MIKQAKRYLFTPLIPRTRRIRFCFGFWGALPHVLPLCRVYLASRIGRLMSGDEKTFRR
jgi:hypothetical protein